MLRFPKSKYVVSVALICTSFFLYGCSGGDKSGTGISTQEESTLTPEESVRLLLSQWNSDGGPIFNILYNLGPDAQVATSSFPSRTITFKELSTGIQWPLTVDNVTYLSQSQAQIVTSYHFNDPAIGKFEIVFYMLKSQLEQRWLLDDIKTYSYPDVIAYERGITGRVYEISNNQELPIASAGIFVYLQPDLQTIVAQATTNSSGYYTITNLIPGTYTIVVVRDGYVKKSYTGIVVQ